MSYYGGKPLSARLYDSVDTPRQYTNILDYVLTMAEFAVVARAKASSASSTAYQHIQTNHGDLFNKGQFLRVEGGAGPDANKGVGYYRTPAGQSVCITSSTFADDNYHDWLWTRETSPNMFRLIVDGTEEDTDSTDPGVTTGTFFSAGGNWYDDGDKQDQPLLGDLAFLYILNKPINATQATALLNGHAVPVGVSILYEFLDGGDTSTVTKVLGP